MKSVKLTFLLFTMSILSLGNLSLADEHPASTEDAKIENSDNSGSNSDSDEPEDKKAKMHDGIRDKTDTVDADTEEDEFKKAKKEPDDPSGEWKSLLGTEP